MKIYIAAVSVGVFINVFEFQRIDPKYYHSEDVGNEVSYIINMSIM
jgi:hypothetical protein